MGFTTQIFFFMFLPICLIAYYCALAVEKMGRLGEWFKKIRLKDIVLIVAGLGFYSWTCFDNIFRLLTYILLVFIFGQVIAKCRKSDWNLVLAKGNEESKKYPLRAVVTGVFVAGVVFYLVYSKYWSEVVSIWNWFMNTEISMHSITAPLAISFLTFSAVSYLADISKGKAEAGNLVDCLLYLSFFPKIISGPTVLWRDFKVQIADRKPQLSALADGVTRIMIGFAKKVIIADTLGGCVAKVPETGIDIPTAWISAFLYMLQIYFDFAGYSDIAIGLAKLFGFEIKENFNFPYCSTSIGEFWRRWHISLGTWFREYVYFPLGGSRKGKKATLRNLGVVFLLTGIWHGNGLNYLIWGCINGALVILERIMAGMTINEKTPKVVKWLGTMAVTLFCWEFFRFGNLDSVILWLKTALGFVTYQNCHTWKYYFDMQIAVIAIVGFLGSTLFGMKPIQSGYNRLVSTKTGYAIEHLVLVCLLIIAIMFMISSGYSPFIYFQY